MASVFDLLSRLGGALLDPCVVVDSNRKVVEFNRHYHALLPRAQARRLKGSECCQFLELGICATDGCLAQRCQGSAEPVRFDEIPGRVVPDGEVHRLIVSATGVPDAGVTIIILRDVSEAADVQRKYRAVLEGDSREKDRLREVVVQKTKELMDANVELNRIQKELMTYKKGLLG